MTVRVALAGDAMLGRGVGEELARASPGRLVDAALAEIMRAADVTIVNLECCVSERGAPNRVPGKPFFFRAPPRAVELLEYLGVDCVTLANNHALDFGEVALLDTFDHLGSAGIDWVGAGWDLERARAPVTMAAGGSPLTVLGFTDHPSVFAAGENKPGVAHLDLGTGLPSWILEAISSHDGCVLVTPHWGPNMVAEPRPYVRAAAKRLLESGTSLVAGHSAHVFHGVDRRVIYDMGDFLDDYRVDPVLRNDLGLLFLVDVDGGTPERLEVVPLKLRHARTEIAIGEDAQWIRARFRGACAAFGHQVTDENDHLSSRLGN